MANDSYPIITIPEDLPEIPEALGTKEKVWVKLGNTYQLLKTGRENTGENWSEKIAYELADLLGIPHAHYELAIHNGVGCVLSPSFIPEDGRLVHGNELIYRMMKGYDGSATYQQKEHTVSRVLAALAVFIPPPSETWGMFIGYVMLDAWIGNTDRHQENWGLIVGKDRSIKLAPTFDHASSLGRELSEDEKSARLSTRDRRFSVRSFSEKARSALYRTNTEKKTLLNTEAFSELSKANPVAARNWAIKLSQISDADVIRVFERMPDKYMTRVSKDFALRMLEFNRAAILKISGLAE